MNEMPTPTVTRDSEFKQLKQVTVREDEDIAKVNDLLTEGWRVLSIAALPDAQHAPAFGQKVIHPGDILVLANGYLLQLLKIGVPGHGRRWHFVHESS